MDVRQLKSILAEMPDEAEVRAIYDGSDYTSVRHVWMSAKGVVMLADHQEPVYDVENRPIGAPGEQDWETPAAWTEAEIQEHQ